MTKNRLHTLQRIADYVKYEITEKDSAELVFVCTHNSRRSQLAEVLLGYHLSIATQKNIMTKSAGTEKTFIPEPILNVLSNNGFSCYDSETNDQSYIITNDSNEGFRKTISSKKVDTATAQLKSFIAVMVCDDADKNCPYLPSAAYRIPLTFTDPKKSDGLLAQDLTYQKSYDTINIEMKLLASLIAEKI